MVGEVLGKVLLEQLKYYLIKYWNWNINDITLYDSLLNYRASSELKFIKYLLWKGCCAGVHVAVRERFASYSQEVNPVTKWRSRDHMRNQQS